MACHSPTLLPPTVLRPCTWGGFVPPNLLSRKQQPPSIAPTPSWRLDPPGGARLQGFQSLELSLTDPQVFADELLDRLFKKSVVTVPR